MKGKVKGRVRVSALLCLFLLFVAAWGRGKRDSDSVLEESIARVSRRHPFVVCDTSKGIFKFELRPDLAPNGTDYMIRAVESGYFNQGIPFFRVNRHLTQFGITKRGHRETDLFLSTRDGALRDLHPTGGLYNETARRLNPWPRGSIASIGGRQLVVVIEANSQMGTNRHDAPMGFIDEKYMVNVFDRLYKYNDLINHKSGGGVEQGKLMSEGMSYIEREYPLTDRIISCHVDE